MIIWQLANSRSLPYGIGVPLMATVISLAVIGGIIQV